MSTRRTGAVGIMIAALSVASCSSSGHPLRSAITGTTESPASTPLPKQHLTIETPDNLSGEQFMTAYLMSEPSARWYAGGGLRSLSGTSLGLEVLVYASTAAAARARCDSIARIAAFFLKGERNYTIQVRGRVKQPTGTIVDATFPPFACNRYSGPVVDPVVTALPATRLLAVERFAKFVDEYVGVFGGSSHGWDYHTDTSDRQVTVAVTDRTPALGRQRCATLRPLANRFLGHYATEVTLRVAGGGSASWPALVCP